MGVINCKYRTDLARLISVNIIQYCDKLNTSRDLNLRSGQYIYNHFFTRNGDLKEVGSLFQFCVCVYEHGQAPVTGSVVVVAVDHKKMPPSTYLLYSSRNSCIASCVQIRLGAFCQ